MIESGLGPARHEASDVTPRFVWLGASLVVGSVVFIAFIILWLFPHSREDQRLRLPLPDFPQPRLQQNPASDLRAFVQKQSASLHGQPRTDASTGVASIPIEEAMRQIAEEKIAGWPGQPEQLATPSAQHPSPESKHAATDNAPSSSSPSAARHRNGTRPGLGARRGARFAPPKTRGPLAAGRGAS